jgi:hypothetical protein
METDDWLITSAIVFNIQWTQNNSKLKLRHSKRGKEYERGKGEQDGK